MRPLATQDERLAEWIGERLGLDDVRPGPTLAGGNANVTRLIESASGRMVLRHPPANAVSDKASAGIAREFAALRALEGAARVPRPIAWCDDAEVIGQPFSLTGWVQGTSITDTLPDAYAAGPATINALGIDLMRALGEVHRVDAAPLLPERFGKPDGFILRQIDRWCAVRDAQSVRDLPLLEPVAEWLRKHVPAPAATSLIHCDYHLDNCLSDLAEPRIAAIIDWEMATLGDPRIDLGLALFFWKRDHGRAIGFPQIQAISNVAGALPREALAHAWSEVSGIAADSLDYFLAFAAWRLAAIVEGAYVLCREGKVDSDYARGLEHDVPNLLAEAAAIIEGKAS